MVAANPGGRTIDASAIVLLGRVWSNYHAFSILTVPGARPPNLSIYSQEGTFFAFPCTPVRVYGGGRAALDWAAGARQGRSARRRGVVG